MKRLIPFLLAGMVLAGCDARDLPATPAPAANPGGWIRVPVVTGVTRHPPSIEFQGQAEPGSRVVLRGAGDSVYAAAADSRGRFAVRLIPPTGGTLLRLQAQEGQTAIPSPDQLLIVDGGRGPVAVLRVGAPSRRLDVTAPGLWSVDSDGETVLAAGLGPSAGQAVTLGVAGHPIQTQVGADRRWSVRVTGVQALQFAGKTYDWPGHAGADGFNVSRAGQGWWALWSGEGGARQSTWLPDAPDQRP